MITVISVITRGPVQVALITRSDRDSVITGGHSWSLVRTNPPVFRHGYETQVLDYSQTGYLTAFSLIGRADKTTRAWRAR